MKKSFSANTFPQKEKRCNDGNKSHTTLKMRRCISDMTLLNKQKKRNDDNQKAKSSRFLITIFVFGSSGPIRFVVNGEDTAAGVIETALKLYAREGRLPVLGSDVNNFYLYPANTGFDAVKPSEAIGSREARNFVMCQKQKKPHMTEARSQVMERKGSGWRAWIQKSLSLRILSH